MIFSRKLIFMICANFCKFFKYSVSSLKAASTPSSASVASVNDQAVHHSIANNGVAAGAFLTAVNARKEREKAAQVMRYIYHLF